MLSLKQLLLASAPAAVLAASGSGHSTRYWDCCKPSCAWSGKASVSAPALTCDANDNPISDANARSGCDGGSAFTCSNNSPWAVNDDLAYGFAATAINGGSESSWCCACYALTFTTGPVAGKTMVVQSTNTGGDLSNNHFDIQIPGGGVGIFDGCTPQWGGLGGERYGGIRSRDECNSFPELLKDGCQWRFDWFKNADNPDFTFEQVQCPTALTDISGCKRNDDAMFPAFKGAPAAPATSSKASEQVEAKETTTMTRPQETSSAPQEAATSSVPEQAESPAPEEPAETSEAATTTTKAAEPVNEPTTSSKPASSTKSSASNSSPTDGSSCPAPKIASLYEQCGGQNWSGATHCAPGSHCVVMNPYYSQCVAQIN